MKDYLGPSNFYPFILVKSSLIIKHFCYSTTNQIGWNGFITDCRTEIKYRGKWSQLKERRRSKRKRKSIVEKKIIYLNEREKKKLREWVAEFTIKQTKNIYNMVLNCFWLFLPPALCSGHLWDVKMKTAHHFPHSHHLAAAYVCIKKHGIWQKTMNNHFFF